MTIADLDIIRFDLKYIPEFQELMNACFGHSYSEEKIRKIFDTEKFGAAKIAYLALDKGRPAGFYGVFPVRMNYFGKEITVAQSGSTMTHPDYQGLGLFTTLAKMCYDLAKSEGIKFVFGWPNKNSYPGFKKKLAWQEMGSLKKFSSRQLTIPLSRAASRFGFLSGLYRAYCAAILFFYKKYDEGFEIPEVDRTVYIPRSTDYLAYKNVNHPVLIKILDVKVIFKIDSGMRIGDMTECSPEKFSRVLKKLKKLAFFLGASEISFLTSPGTTWEKKFTGIWKEEALLPHMYVQFYDEYPLPGGYFTNLDADTF